MTLVRLIHGHRLRADRRGVAAVEFAIGGLVLFALMFGIVNLGDLAWTYETLCQGVAAAARYASVTTSAGLAAMASGDSFASVCASAADVQSRFDSRIAPTIAATKVPKLALTWGGSLTPCNAGAGTPAIAALPGGWVDVSTIFLWQPVAMPDVFGGVSLEAGDIEPVLNAPAS